MKKFMFIMPLMAVSLLASCGGSKEPINPLKIDLYKKKIEYDVTGKNVTSTTEYEYNDKDLLEKETKIYQDNPGNKIVYEYNYNEHENEIGNHTISYEDGTITSQSWMRKTYTYDEQNLIIKIVNESSDNNEDWEFLNYYEYEYKQNVEIEKLYCEEGLEQTTTYTYDKKGNLINEKRIYNGQGEGELLGWENVYTVDNNGCATKIENFDILESGERGDLDSVSEITYFKKLWYRPLKKINTYYNKGKIDSYSTIEREYDAKNRVTLYKNYEGKEEGDSPYYYFYRIYEY